MRIVQTLIFVLILISQCIAQPKQLLDQVIALVGENPIFLSELEAEYLQAKSQYESFDGDLKCEILNQILMQKLMLHKADMDSIVIADEAVEEELERKIRYFVSQIGDEDKLEAYLGKSINQYKAEMRTKMKQQMLVQKTNYAIIENIKVNPSEVKKYFDQIPKDSLPLIGLEIELGQILIKPKPTLESKVYALNTINDFRNDIMKGKKKFEFIAKGYSDDKGSGMQGGELGYFKRGDMVPEFEAIAFDLKPDSISQVIETQYGYHILKLIDRKGERVNVRHILIKPKILNSDLKETETLCKFIIQKIKFDSFTFTDAVNKYSEDEQTKMNGGFYSDPNIGSTKIDIQMLDAEIVQQVQTLKPGEFSPVTPVQMPDGSVAFRILYLKSESKPHKANLQDDYQKIQAAALERKKEKEILDWATKYMKDVHISINTNYKDCEELQMWKSKIK